jgi:hypothetical protein
MTTKGMKKKGKKKVSKKSVKRSVKKSPSKSKTSEIKDDEFSMVQFVLGVCLCLFASGLMYINFASLGFRLAVGIAGILLIATSPFGIVTKLKK